MEELELCPLQKQEASEEMGQVRERHTGNVRIQTYWLLFLLVEQITIFKHRPRIILIQIFPLV